MIEKIGDPLVHLVRNSIDHGIEMPDVRVAHGKPATRHDAPRTPVTRAATSSVEVERRRRRARQRSASWPRRAERGLVGPNDVLSDEQVYELIFLPGFSTAETTTDVSGRGVGMDVVRRNVKELGGKIEVKLDARAGLRFLITLPLTLAIVDGAVASRRSETYIVPLLSIVESMQINQSRSIAIRAHGRRSSGSATTTSP